MSFAEGGMRVIGRRAIARYGPRGPTEDEIAVVHSIVSMMPRVVPKGVYRYSNHAEANRAADGWVVDGAVARARELAR